MSIISRFIALDRFGRRLGMEAILMVWYSKAVLLFMPMRKISIRYPSVPGNKESEDVFAMAKEVGRALRRTDRFVPWRNRCLVKSLAGRMMLNRRGIASVLFLGAAIDTAGRLQAHAWLKAGDIEVVEQGDEYRVLHGF